MSLAVGLSHSESVVVSQENVASAIGSGLVDVFATPMMIALLELAAARCIEPHLAPGQVSVGGHVNVSHTGATPRGMTVTATATVTEVDRRRIAYRVVVQDDCGVVGEGTHTRFVVDRDKFMEKAAAKGK